MTHPESQDLLLDLAYGELPAPRAAELAAHLAGCAECQREKAALDEARRLAAPLREMEEPSPGFDEPILAAARAQAQLEHEGNIGQVIEVQGSVKPLGIEPAQVDAHAKVAAPRREQRRPRWMVRVALGGSVAAAAALALVVSTSLQQKHEVESPRPAKDQAYEIRIQPAPLPQAAGEGVREARKEEAAPAPVAAAKPQETRQPEPSRRAPDARMARKAAAPEDLAGPGALGGLKGGSGGDALDSMVVREPGSPAAHPAAAAPPPPAAAPTTAAPATAARLPAVASAAPPAAAAAEKKAAGEDAPPPVAQSPAATGAPAMVQNRPQQVASAGSSQPAAPPAAKASPRGAAELEQQAQEARHGGSYPLAAILYREAAGLRRAETPQGNEGAWDLAHAVECLAAAGRFDEARDLRDELARLYPGEPGAFAAAGRVLREVDSPAQLKSRPPAKAKSDSSSSVPGDF